METNPTIHNSITTYFLTSQVLVYCKLFYLDLFYSSLYCPNIKRFYKVSPKLTYYKDITEIFTVPIKKAVSFFHFFFLYQMSLGFRFFWKKKKELKSLKVYCVLLIPIVLNTDIKKNLVRKAVDSHLVFLYTYLKYSLVLLLNWTDLYAYTINSKGLIFDIQRYPYYLYFKQFFIDWFHHKYRPISICVPSTGYLLPINLVYLLRLFQIPTVSF